MGGLPQSLIRGSLAAFVAAMALGAPAAHAQFGPAPVDLALTISDNPDPVETNNASFQYEFEVRNLDPVNAAHGVRTVFEVPHHVALPGPLPGNCYQPAGDKLVCELGSIPPGGVRTGSFKVKHLLNGPIQFQGSVVYNGSDTNSANNTDFETTTVTGQQAPSWTVQVNRVGPGTVRGHGISCGIDFNPGLDCSEPFSEGGTATLRANDAANFVGWGGDCAFAGSNPVCSLPVTGNMNVDATFVASQPPSAGFSIDRQTGEPREMVMFDASNVVNAQTIEYKVDPPGPGGFKGGFTTSSLSPFTGMRLTTPGTYKVTQTVTGPGGVAVANQNVSISGSTNFLGKPPPSVSFSSSDEALVKPGPTASATCAVNGQLVVGLAEANGCFYHAAEPQKLPEAERPVANEYWSLNLLFSSLNQPECRNQDDLPAACAEAAAKQGVDIYYTRGPMKLNGMLVTPAAGAAVVFYPAIGKVVSSNAKVTFEGPDIPAFPAHNGPLNLDVGISDFTSTRKSLSLFTFNASQLPDIGGFKIDGQMSISLAQEGARRFSELAVNMTLPEEFSTSADTRPSGGVKLQSTNAEGIVLSNLDIDIPEAFLGGVRLSKLTFTYKRAGEPSQGCDSKWWKATAEIFLIPASGEDGSGLSLAPPPERNGIAFCAGGFHSGGGIFTFGEPEAPQIFPGVFLNTIEFNMQLENPTVFSGAASVKAAKIVRAAGGLLVAFARPDAPYVIKAEDGGNTLAALAGTRLESTSFALGGTVGVELPGEDNVLNLGNASALYSYPDYIKADGLARINTFLYTIEASGGLEANAATRRFDAFARGEVCLAGGIRIEGVGACVAGEARASSKGTSACLIIVDDAFEPGVGYAWGDNFPHIFNGVTDGCKPSMYWEQNIGGARLAAQRMLAPEIGPPAPLRGGAGTSPISFTVKPGDTTKNVELHGMGGAPAVQIEAPDGEISTTVPNEMQVGEHLQNLAWEEYDYTWVSVTNGEPGEYLVTPLDGSVPIEEMFETRPTPEEGMTARVQGSGVDRVLRYDVGEDPGQKVTFIERGKGIWNEIGKASEGKGTIPFKPGPAQEGKREIIAQYEVDGIPGPVEVLDDYNAPPPLTAGQTNGVSVQRQGKSLEISWDKTPGAADYGVVVTQKNGVQKSQTLPAGERTLKIGGISPIQAGTVTVSGIGPLGDIGSEDAARFKATKKKPDRRIPYDQLGEGGPDL